MEFKLGDIVEVTANGAEYIRQRNTNVYDIFLNNLLKIELIDWDDWVNLQYFVIIKDNDIKKQGVWLKKESIELSKKYYRKEKLKQLKNDI
jgi:hypothetical protein